MISMTVLVIHYAMSFRERTCEGKEDVTMSAFTPSTPDNSQFALAAESGDVPEYYRKSALLVFVVDDVLNP